MKMNEKKAAGHDGICSKELKVVADKIAWQLATLFNESLETGEIPSDFKVGNIIPIFKAGPPLDLSFWSFLTFLHHGIEEVERHLL